MSAEVDPGFRIVDREPEQITHLFLIPDAIQYLARLETRAVNNFHDLLVFLGPQGQTGSVRIILECAIEENPHPGESFRDVSAATYLALNRSRALHPDYGVIGIGTHVGIAKGIPYILQLFGIYYASHLMSGIPGTGIAQDRSQLGFYTRGKDSTFTAIPNIHFITQQPFSSLRTRLFQNP